MSQHESNVSVTNEYDKGLNGFLSFNMPQSAMVELVPRGARITASDPGGQRVQPGQLKGVKRSTVKVFSCASRRRLQDAFLRFEYKKGIMISVCYTLPGVELSTDQQTAIFDAFAKSVVKRGWCGIWRKEQQKREMLHWHVWQGFPCRPDGGVNLFYINEALKYEWLKACDTVGKVKHEKPSVDGNYWDLCSKAHGGNKYIVQWKYEADEAGSDEFFKYMSAHATKDTHQVANGKGRHWGIFGRREFVKVPVEKMRITNKEYDEILRIWNEQTYPERMARHQKLLARVLKQYKGNPPDNVVAMLNIRADNLQRGIGGKGTVRIFGARKFKEIVKAVVDKAPF